jgi:hypothetical protein
VCEIGVSELFGSVDDPFVRHHMDPQHTRRAWVLGRAVVVDGTRPDHATSRPGRSSPASARSRTSPS